MNLDNFENPWEHIRLLSDGKRNEALIALMASRCPGKRVVEVGCGTGILSCVAARMGASHVYAIEPTAIVEEARALVEANGLTDRVTVLEGRVEELEAIEVDFAFSELLNADPFEEGVLEAMQAVRPWLADGGLSSPAGLKVFVALARLPDSARELAMAKSQCQDWERRFSLDLSSVTHVFEDAGSYKYVYEVPEIVSETACIWELVVGRDDRPEEPVRVSLRVNEPGPVSAAVIWFEADLGDGATMHNRPLSTNHWGQLVFGWPQEVGLRAGDRVDLEVWDGDDGLEVRFISTESRA